MVITHLLYQARQLDLGQQHVAHAQLRILLDLIIYGDRFNESRNCHVSASLTKVMVWFLVY